MGEVGSVQRVFQRFSWNKFGHLRGFDLDGLTRAGIAASACSSLGCLKRAKAHQLHFAAFLQRAFDGFSE